MTGKKRGWEEPLKLFN